MATRQWASKEMPGGWLRATVTLTADGDVSDLLELPNWPQKNLQVVVGGAITDLDIQQSNDGVTFADLHQAHDPTLTFTSLVAAMQADVFENPRYIKVTAYDEGAGGDTTIEICAYTSR